MKTKSTFRLSESRGNLFTLPSVRKVSEANAEKAIYRGSLGALYVSVCKFMLVNFPPQIPEPPLYETPSPLYEIPSRPPSSPLLSLRFSLFPHSLLSSFPSPLFSPFSPRMSLTTLVFFYCAAAFSRRRTFSSFFPFFPLTACRG